MNPLSIRLKNFQGMANKHPDYMIYIGIALTVAFFNLIAIFGLDTLLHDDPALYGMVIAGKFPKFMAKYSLIYASKEWIAWNIMAYSPNLIRGLYVVLLMIPLSCCFYYLYHAKFGFSRITAFTAAILPNILPYQWQIPAGINMSYTLWGLLFAVFSLILGLHYLNKTTSMNWIRLLGAVAFYFIAIEFMRQSLFLFPPFALAFLGCTKFNKKHIWLISSFFMLAVTKYIWMTTITKKYLIKDIPAGEILKRIGLYFKWSLPFPNIEPVFLTLICIIIVLISFILYIRNANSRLKLINKNFSHMNRKIYVLYIYSFFICWIFSTIFVFTFMHEYCTPRYTHITSFGINAILIFSIYLILNRGFFRRYKLLIFIFTVIIIFSGVYRYFYLKQIYTKKNQVQSIIVRDLNKLKLPLNSQVAISRAAELGVSWGWVPSSGCLKFALKRKDINGLIGSINYKGYYNFDNHFNPRERGWNLRSSMTGLSIEKPTFLFLVLKKQKKLKQLEYALQWKGKTKNEPWTILKANKKTGKITPFLSGVGWSEYLSTIRKLEKNGISQSDILWGGPPCQKELERLGFDPILLQGDFYNRFKSIESLNAKKVQLISSSSTTPIAKNIYFENSFQLVPFFSNEVSEVSVENGTIGKVIYILWKSLKKQTTDKYLLEISLPGNPKKTWINWRRFHPPGLELEAGDYIFGSIIIPADKFKEAENLGIRIYADGPPKWPAFKIQGNHKTDQKGSRLLIPLKNANK